MNKTLLGLSFSITQHKPEMLIRQQDGDQHSVWSGPLCCVYTVFFITNQGRRKWKVFITLIIPPADTSRTWGYGENRSRKECEEGQIELHLKDSELKRWKRGWFLSCIRCHKGQGMLQTTLCNFVRLCLKEKCLYFLKLFFNLILNGEKVYSSRNQTGSWFHRRRAW